MMLAFFPIFIDWNEREIKFTTPEILYYDGLKLRRESEYSPVAVVCY